MQLPDRSQFLGRERNRKAAVHIAGPVLENERGKTAGIGKERLQLPADSPDVGGRLCSSSFASIRSISMSLTYHFSKHARPARHTLHDVLTELSHKERCTERMKSNEKPAQRRKAYDDGPYEENFAFVTNHDWLPLLSAGCQARPVQRFPPPLRRMPRKASARRRRAQTHTGPRNPTSERNTPALVHAFPAGGRPCPAGRGILQREAEQSLPVGKRPYEIGAGQLFHQEARLFLRRLFAHRKRRIQPKNGDGASSTGNGNTANREIEMQFFERRKFRRPPSMKG